MPGQSSGTTNSPPSIKPSTLYKALLPPARNRKFCKNYAVTLMSSALWNPRSLGKSVRQTTGLWIIFVSVAPCGPFENVVEFHRASRDGLEYPTGVTEVDDMIAAQESRDYSVKFTHGDIAWRHIYYADGKITGIIDWEYAGWYPGHWEYAMTWHSFMDCPNLRDDIPVILDAFPEELKMEQARKGLLVD
ncbi:hypothetical protein M432DRAFT_666662 [Thermoascus aurantiacus ATCC 26904]